MKHHPYNATITWTGNRGSGTSEYKAYDRSHDIGIKGKRVIEGSSDPSFRGDPSKHTPEDMLVSSLSTCHMLWYLHLCAVNGVIVTDYVDHATGVMEENSDGSGQFIGVTLNPVVTVQSEEMVERAIGLHLDATRKCFIARSVNFDVQHKPQVVVAGTTKPAFSVS
ncbi:OsmC family protein [Chryseolinea sp. T2]|uniref:OsmC family protein n=1 Tax=Chryseolinea sp. T2 TaxID=3129255 RepID=UPI00307866C7